jgi:hypothetical protein
VREHDGGLSLQGLEIAAGEVRAGLGRDEQPIHLLEQRPRRPLLTAFASAAVISSMRTMRPDRLEPGRTGSPITRQQRASGGIRPRSISYGLGVVEGAVQLEQAGPEIGSLARVSGDTGAAPAAAAAPTPRFFQQRLDVGRSVVILIERPRRATLILRTIPVPRPLPSGSRSTRLADAMIGAPSSGTRASTRRRSASPSVARQVAIATIEAGRPGEGGVPLQLSHVFADVMVVAPALGNAADGPMRVVSSNPSTPL